MYFVLLAVALIITVLLLIKITVTVYVTKHQSEKFSSEIRLSFLGITIDLSKKDKPVRKSASVRAEKEDTDTVLEKITKLRVNIARGKYTYLLSKRYVRKKIHIDKFDLSVTFGLDDAAQTGIATGVLWGGIYGIFGFVDSLFTVKSHNFNVTPVFDGECLDAKFNTVVKARVVNILAVAFAVLINYIKTGKNL